MKTLRWMLVLATLSLAAPVEASPIYWSRTYVTGNANGFGVSGDSGQVTSTDAAVMSRTSTVLGNSTTSTAWVDDGSLHSITFGTGNGSGFAQSSFFETFTPTSSSLAPATAVMLQMDLALTYSLIASPVLCGSGAANSATVLGQMTFNGSIIGNAVQRQDSTCDTGDFTTGTGLVQLFIGQEFVVQTTLSAMGGGQTGTTRTADASNTLRLFLTPLADFSLATASGLTYDRPASAVPEPTSLLLLGMGLAGLLTWRNRRGH